MRVHGCRADAKEIIGSVRRAAQKSGQGKRQRAKAAAGESSKSAGACPVFNFFQQESNEKACVVNA